MTRVMLDQSQAAGGSEMVDVDGLRVADGSLGVIKAKKPLVGSGCGPGYGRFWCRLQVQVRESFAGV
jgi:hypothetical protein